MPRSSRDLPPMFMWDLEKCVNAQTPFSEQQLIMLFDICSGLQLGGFNGKNPATIEDITDHWPEASEFVNKHNRIFLQTVLQAPDKTGLHWYPAINPNWSSGFRERWPETWIKIHCDNRIRKAFAAAMFVGCAKMRIDFDTTDPIITAFPTIKGYEDDPLIVHIRKRDVLIGHTIDLVEKLMKLRLTLPGSLTFEWWERPTGVVGDEIWLSNENPDWMSQKLEGSTRISDQQIKFLLTSITLGDTT